LKKDLNWFFGEIGLEKNECKLDGCNEKFVYNEDVNLFQKSLQKKLKNFYLLELYGGQNGQLATEYRVYRACWMAQWTVLGKAGGRYGSFWKLTDRDLKERG